MTTWIRKNKLISSKLSTTIVICVEYKLIIMMALGLCLLFTSNNLQCVMCNQPFRSIYGTHNEIHSFDRNVFSSFRLSSPSIYNPHPRRPVSDKVNLFHLHIYSPEKLSMQHCGLSKYSLHTKAPWFIVQTTSCKQNKGSGRKNMDKSKKKKILTKVIHIHRY